jgi:hypothetical protein
MAITFTDGFGAGRFSLYCNGKARQQILNSKINIVSQAKIQQERPDNILILPWNLREEVLAQLSYSYVREWNARFVTAIPTLELL